MKSNQKENNLNKFPKGRDDLGRALIMSQLSHWIQAAKLKYGPGLHYPQHTCTVLLQKTLDVI